MEGGAEIFIKIILPAVVIFTMIVIGMGLKMTSFKVLVRTPKPFLLGATLQLFALPLVAFTLLHIFTLPPALSVGVMILAFCPGGVSTNIFCKWAGANVSLSVSLTAILSMVTGLTVPLLIMLSVSYFMGQAAPEIMVSKLSIQMVVLSTVPVALGVGIRHAFPRVIDEIEPVLFKVISGLFVIVIAVALSSNWPVFAANFLKLAPVLISLTVVLILLGHWTAKKAGLSNSDITSVVIEASIQNGTLGMQLGALIATGTAVVSQAAFSDFALPSAVYSITMYMVVAPYLLLVRSRGA